MFFPLVCKPTATAESLSTTLTNSEQQHCCIHICLFSRRIYDQCWLFALQGASNLLPCWVRSQPSVRIFIPSPLTLTHCWFTNSPALFVLPLPHFAASDTTEDASCLLLLFRWFHDKDGTVEEKNKERVLKTLLISAADVSWCGFSVCFSGKMLLQCDWLVYSVKVSDFGNWGRWTYANDSKFQILKQLQTTKILGLVYHHCISNSNRELLTDTSLYWSVKENWPVKSSLSHWVGPQQWTKIHIQTRALSTPRITELFVHVVSVGGWATEWFVNSQLSLTASGQRWSWSEKRKSELLLTMTC